MWIDEIKKHLGDSPIVNSFFMAGKSKGKCPKDYDSDALKKGVSIEHEHTIDDFIATKIAMDHLEENLNYYDILEKNGL